MQTHASREIAEAMMDRLLPLYPRAVAVTRTCATCGGLGEVVVQDRRSCFSAIDPGSIILACSYCDDGRETMMCEHLGHGAATTVILDEGVEHYWCDGCATILDGLLGYDRVVAFALAVTP